MIYWDNGHDRLGHAIMGHILGHDRSGHILELDISGHILAYYFIRT